MLSSAELIAEYAAECSIPAIGEIDPQAATYELMENVGIAQSFMASVDGADVGFAVVLTPVLPHYGKKIATVESLFIAQASRRSGAGQELMQAVEEYAKDAGCVGILYSSPAGGKLERLLTARSEYYRTNAVFFRRFQ